MACLLGMGHLISAVQYVYVQKLNNLYHKKAVDVAVADGGHLSAHSL